MKSHSELRLSRFCDWYSMTPTAVRHMRLGIGAACMFLFAVAAPAQDLDPRSYIHVPVDGTLLIAGFSYSDGGVTTDVTSPVQDLHATVETPSLGVGRTFSFFGQTAQVYAVLPYSWAQASALVGGENMSITRAGFPDARMRFSVLFCGAPAASVEEFGNLPRQTILGTSLTVVTPVGQFYPEKLINLGSNRWAFKPELAISHPVNERWLIDFYAGVWLFTVNHSFYPGNSTRTQDPLVSFQAHVSYAFQPQMWMAFDITFYAGGLTSVNGVNMNDRQNNMRLGGTLLVPVGGRHSVKIAGSTGAVVRYGANFTVLSIGWQTMFF